MGIISDASPHCRGRGWNALHIHREAPVWASPMFIPLKILLLLQFPQPKECCQCSSASSPKSKAFIFSPLYTINQYHQILSGFTFIIYAKSDCFLLPPITTNLLHDSIIPLPSHQPHPFCYVAYP